MLVLQPDGLKNVTSDLLPVGPVVERISNFLRAYVANWHNGIMRDQLIRQFDSLLTNGIRLEHFEAFVLENLQAVLDSGEQDAIALFNAADILLIEFRDGEITLSQVIEEMESEIRNLFTTSILFPASSAPTCSSDYEAETLQFCAAFNEPVSTDRLVLEQSFSAQGRQP